MTTLIFTAILLRQPIRMAAGYVRTVDRTDGIAVSQTAARKFMAPGKPDLWLVGVAHIGLKKYYTDIQELLDAQDLVLFEGVRPKDNSGKPRPVDPKAQPQIYQVIGNAIGLDFQLSDIHYDRPNWINSDLTLDQLDQLNKKTNGGKPSQFDMVKNMLNPESPQSKMLATFFQTATPGMKEAFKIFLVDKLAKVDTLLATVADPSTLKLLLTARNKSVEDVFGKFTMLSPPPEVSSHFLRSSPPIGPSESIQGKVWLPRGAAAMVHIC